MKANGQQTQIEKEIQHILAIVENMTGLSSRWNGQVELVPDADFKGKKPFRCHILIHADLASQEVRWATLIHEALHSVSAGYVRDDYQAFRGWEEGVVEQLQRLLRPAILASLGVDIAEAVFQHQEVTHRYNVYIQALERLRATLAGESEPTDAQIFYTRLLATPIRERPGYILGLAYQQPGPLRFEFVKTFSAANAILIGRF